MMKKSIITNFTSGTPSSTYSTTTGYTVGSEWVNTDNGNRFYHKTDGNWVLLGTESPFYIQGGTSSAFDTTSDIYRTGALNIGSGTATNGRFVVSSSGGTVSLVVSESGSIYNGSLFDLKYGYNSLPSFGKLPIDEYGDLDNGTGYTPGYYTASTSLVYGPYTLNVYPVVHIYVDGLGEAYIQSVVSIGSGWVDDGNSMVFTADIPGGSDYSFYLYLLPGFNTTIGNYSLSSNITGSYNVAFGHKSLYSNTTGEANTAIGYQSLLSNTTGSANIALGVYSLYHNNSGGDNIALGVYSLYNNTVGSDNMAIGPLSALLENTTGNSNIALGAQSLRNNTIGSYNIGLGENSLYKNKIGNYNIAIGNDSGSTTVDGIYVTISNNSIFIGTGTRPQLDDQTNQIVIGYGATGNGSNTVTLGSDYITRTYLKGKVVIADGTQASGYVLTSDSNGVASWTSSVSILTDYNFKNIDSSLVSGTYSVLATDYTKTLVYTGTSSISVVLSTGTTYSVGRWINVLQKGAGQITIGANGFILSYSSDELPTTFGANSLATVLVYSSSTPELIVSGKLKLA
jgi:hypothetical protein